MKEEREKHMTKSAGRQRLSAYLSFPITGPTQEPWINLC